MIIKKELIKRCIAGDTILVPVGKAVYDSNGLFVLNELGAFLWERLAAARDEEELLQAVLEQYDVPEQQAREDISEFLCTLRQMEII